MKLFPLLATAIALTALSTSSCSVFNKSGATVADKNAEVKATPVKNNSQTSSYDESQIAPLLGCWSVTEINGEKVVVNGENHPQFTFEAIPEAKTAASGNRL